MTGTPINIFGLLTGNGKLPGSNQIEGYNQENENNNILPFGAIIKELLPLQPGNEVTGDEVFINQNVISFDSVKLKPFDILQNTELLPKERELTSLNIIPAELDENNLSGKTVSLEDGQNKVSPEIKSNMTSFNKEWQSLLSTTSTPLQDNIKDILNKTHSAPEPGNYEIIESKISSGKLNLEVVNTNQPEQKIKLVIPAELLQGDKKDGVQNNIVTNEFTSDNYQFEKTKFEQYLSKLNLKEIEITSIKNDINVSEMPDAVEVNLVAENAGVEIYLKGKFNKNRIKTGTINRFKNINNRKLNTETKVDNNIIFDNDLEFVPDTQKHVVNNTNHIKNKVLFNKLSLVEDINTIENKNTIDNLPEKLESVFGYEKFSSDRNSVENKIEIQPLRFTLPDNIKTVLKPGGQAVLLKIEPEHLGPAKLRLSLHNDKIRARITVNSAIAKTTIENSLDRLVDQLAKADIKIDYFEVTVNDDSNKNEFFNHQSYRRQSFSNRQIKMDDEHAIEELIPVQPYQPDSIHYINNSGVNLLA